MRETACLFTCSLTLHVRVRAFAQEELDELVAVLDAGGYHEGRPAHVVLRWEGGRKEIVSARFEIREKGRGEGSSHLNVHVETLLLGEELHYVQLVCARGPVDGQAAVVVFPLAQFGVDLGGNECGQLVRSRG